MLAPIVFVIGLIYAREKHRSGAGSGGGARTNYLSLIPMFVLGMIAMVILRTLGLLPNVTIHLSKESALGAGEHAFSVADVFQHVSMFCIVVSMAGAGLETRFDLFRKLGPKPFLAATLAFAVIAAVILALTRIAVL
jgi:uncharacterized membrane protein YadS